MWKGCLILLLLLCCFVYDFLLVEFIYLYATRLLPKYIKWISRDFLRAFACANVGHLKVKLWMVCWNDQVRHGILYACVCWKSHSVLTYFYSLSKLTLLALKRMSSMNIMNLLSFEPCWFFIVSWVVKIVTYLALILILIAYIKEQQQTVT